MHGAGRTRSLRIRGSRRHGVRTGAATVGLQRLHALPDCICHRDSVFSGELVQAAPISQVREPTMANKWQSRGLELPQFITIPVGWTAATESFSFTAPSPLGWFA